MSRYYEVTMTTEETTEQEETTYVKLADDGDDVRGGQSSQSVDAEQLTSMSHEESSRFVIKGVIDPRTTSEISMDQVDYRSPSLGGGVHTVHADTRGLARRAHMHWRRYLWGAGARAPSTSNCFIFFGGLSIRTKSDTDFVRLPLRTYLSHSVNCVRFCFWRCL